MLHLWSTKVVASSIKAIIWVHLAQGNPQNELRNWDTGREIMRMSLIRDLCIWPSTTIHLLRRLLLTQACPVGISSHRFPQNKAATYPFRSRNLKIFRIRVMNLRRRLISISKIKTRLSKNWLENMDFAAISRDIWILSSCSTELTKRWKTLN